MAVLLEVVAVLLRRLRWWLLLVAMALLLHRPWLLLLTMMAMALLLLLLWLLLLLVVVALLSTGVLSLRPSLPSASSPSCYRAPRRYYPFLLPPPSSLQRRSRLARGSRRI